jgi:hypothetical protein
MCVRTSRERLRLFERLVGQHSGRCKQKQPYCDNSGVRSQESELTPSRSSCFYVNQELSDGTQMGNEVVTRWLEGRSIRAQILIEFHRISANAAPLRETLATL